MLKQHAMTFLLPMRSATTGTANRVRTLLAFRLAARLGALYRGAQDWATA